MAAVPSLPVQTDADAQETQEWLDALSAVIQQEGPERAHYLIEKQIELARAASVNVAYSANTAYVNTIRPTRRCARRAITRLKTVSVPTCAGTRWPWCRAPTRAIQSRRPYRELRLGRDALRRRFQSLLARAHRTPRRRHGVRAGPFLARHLRACVHARRLTEEQMDHFRREVDGRGCRRIRIRG